MKGIRLTLLVLAIAITHSGCDSKDAWMPDSPSSTPIEGFKISTSHSFNDWTHVFMNVEDAKAKNPMGMAMLIKEGNFELPFNVFSISAPGPSYVETQYEVLYYDENRTQIRVVEDEGDRLGMIMEMGSDPNKSASVAHTFIYPGTKVRIGGETYEIGADGWYNEGVLVRSFENGAPQN